MLDLFWWQYLFIGLTFIWSGFVRSGLGFGGAVLSLPFLLLIHDDPLVFLPIISIHLLVFSGWIVWRGHQKAAQEGIQSQGGTIDWPALKDTLKIMMIPKIIGVFGLITLPNQVMSVIILLIVSVYALGYLLNKPFRSDRPWVDRLFLIIGGYVSGTSLIAAPLVTAVLGTKIAKHQLRDTLFVLWFILVSIKLGSFILFDIDLQLIHQLWLFPCAWIGHLLGQKLHEYVLRSDARIFYRGLGGVLLVTSFAGIARTFF